LNNIDIEQLNGSDQIEYKRIRDEVNAEIERLFNEVNGLQKDFKGQDFD